MDVSFFVTNLKKLTQQRNVFFILVLSQSLVICVLAFLLNTKSERLIMIPPIGPSYWMEEREVSDSYMESMGIFLADLLLNRSPKDSEWRSHSLLKYAHPSSYHSIQAILNKENQQIEKEGYSFIFVVEESFIDKSSASFVVEGERQVFLSRKNSAPYCAQRDKKRYRLGFLCERGRLFLISLKEEKIA